MFTDDYAFGWTDLNIIRHAELTNKLSSMVLTHLDVLNDVETIKLATRYILKDGGETQIFQNSLPAKIDDWEEMEPEFIEVPGWKQDLSNYDSFDRLPTEAQSFIRRLEQLSKKRLNYVCVNDEKE
mgnify:CR=1 FL=1